MTSPRDTLVIRDGEGPSAPKLAVLTGPASENPKYVTSTQSQLYLYLTTSGNGGSPGFQIKYYQGCEQILTAANGSVSSPAFGLAQYPSNQDCTYLIRRPKGGPLSLRFTHFDLDDADFVQVRIMDRNVVQAFCYVSQFSVFGLGSNRRRNVMKL